MDGVVYFRVSDPIASVANVTNADFSTRLLAQTTLRNVLGTKNLSELLSDREGIAHSMQVLEPTKESWWRSSSASFFLIVWSWWTGYLPVCYCCPFIFQSNLDEATDNWGIKVERVEIKDVKLPHQLQRAMAAEAEATREARAKVRMHTVQPSPPVSSRSLINPPAAPLLYVSLQVIAAEGEMNASRALKEASLVIAESPSALQLRYLQTLNTIAAEKNSTIIFPLPIDVLTHFMRKWPPPQWALSLTPCLWAVLWYISTTLLKTSQDLSRLVL